MMDLTYKRDFSGLTGLRFLAAFLVFLFHVHIRFPLAADGMVSNFLNQGAVGMTVFFMLSGFVISHRYLNREFCDREFISARLARIYPVYIISFLLALPIIYFQIPEIGSGDARGFAKFFIILITYISMTQAWIPMLFNFVNNSANWSLSVEAFMYTTFLFTHDRIKSISTSLSVKFIPILLLFSILPSIAYYIFDDHPTYGLQIFYAMPIFRICEFFIGVLTYKLMMASQAFCKVCTRAFLPLLVLSAIYLCGIESRFPIFVIHNWLIVPLMISFLVCLCDDRTLLTKFFSNPVLHYFGKISFSFYCFQFHILTFVTYAKNYVNLSPLNYLMATFSMLLVVSILSYHFIEEPMRRLVRERFGARRNPLIATA